MYATNINVLLYKKIKEMLAKSGRQYYIIC